MSAVESCCLQDKTDVKVRIVKIHPIVFRRKPGNWMYLSRVVI